MESITITPRKYDTIATDENGMRLGSYDRTAGARRGMINGRIWQCSYDEWLTELEKVAQ